MATFRIGQRVKLVRHIPVNYLFGFIPVPELVGQQGVIRARAEDAPVHDWILELDGSGCRVYCQSDELEPLYDGNIPVSWDALKGLWLPEDLKELV